MRLLAIRFFGMGILLLSFSGESLSYFVAINGSDNNAGTLESPFRTLRHAADKLVPGDTCYIRGGTYRETLVPARSGTSEAPITFSAYANEAVTVSACEIISGWQKATHQVYSALVDWDLGDGYNQVFVNGTMVHETQFPEFGTGDLFPSAVAGVSVGGGQGAVITSAAWAGHPKNFWAGAWFCGGIDVRWSWQCARIISSMGDAIVVDPATKSKPWFVGTGSGFIWGVPTLLGSNNEWHLSGQPTRKLLKIHLGGGGNPGAYTVEMKRRNWCIDFDKHHYITVRGLHLWGGAVRLSGSCNVLENCQMRFLSHYMKYAWGYACDGGFSQGSGILIDGTSNTVYACTISDTAGSGIITAGSDNVIARNLIFNTDYSGTYACGIRLTGTRDFVAYNTIHTSGRDILEAGGAGHLISFNDFHNPGQMCLDTGVIYAWGVNAQSATGERTRLAYNWVHDNRGAGATPLIYLDNWCRNFIVDHNVCWNSAGDSGLRVNAPAAGHRIFNNTLFNCDDMCTHTYDMWPGNNPDPTFWTGDRYQFTSANNLFLGTAPQSQLIDWKRDDFRLKPHAAAINSGIYVSGSTDLVPEVGPADKGAYEFGGLAWKAGVNGWRQPSLSIIPLSERTLKLTSSPGATFFQLVTTTNSHPPFSWTVVTNTPAVSMTEWSVTVDILPGQMRQFRLKSK